MEARLRVEVVEPAVRRGWRLAITLTPTAARWLDAAGELDRLRALTELPVRSTSRLPSEPKPYPMPDAFLFVPATANSLAKLALGIADNQALTVLCENIGTTPMIVFPRINAAHARQPNWNTHLNSLRSVGIDLIYGDDVWPLAEPRQAGPRDLPWSAILATAKQYC